jgi:hypothetical protein
MSLNGLARRIDRLEEASPDEIEAILVPGEIFLNAEFLGQCTTAERAFLAGISRPYSRGIIIMMRDRTNDELVSIRAIALRLKSLEVDRPS